MPHKWQLDLKPLVYKVDKVAEMSERNHLDLGNGMSDEAYALACIAERLERIVELLEYGLIRDMRNDDAQT